MRFSTNCSRICQNTLKKEYENLELATLCARENRLVNFTSCYSHVQQYGCYLFNGYTIRLLLGALYSCADLQGLSENAYALTTNLQENIHCTPVTYNYLKIVILHILQGNFYIHKTFLYFICLSLIMISAISTASCII